LMGAWKGSCNPSNNSMGGLEKPLS
jgi:hypothetical protein